MGRRCSHGASNGRSSSRTCTNDHSCCTGLRLFGVQLQAADPPDADVTKKSSGAPSSAARLPSSANSSTSSSLLSIGKAADVDAAGGGYLSDGLVARAQERKKGVPWTEEEHRAFLAGLEKLGKGDWRGISRHFVTSRTPTQVASHAQKFFLRQTGPSEKRRRSSLFDAVGSGGGGGVSVLRPGGEDATILYDSHASAASSLRKTGKGRAAIDLNGSGTGEDSTGQTTPPCPATPIQRGLGDQVPSRSASPSQLRAGPTMPPPAGLGRLPSLELTIASPVAEQRSSPPGSFFAKGVVAVT